ncbi:MAG: hypoxanthine phosphoribosyltransferase [Fimbriimonadales bacterium]
MRPIETLVSEDEIRQKVSELAARIKADYDGKLPLLVGVLKGCVYFLSDLSRAMGRCEMDFMAVESYDGETSTGAVKIRMDLGTNIEGRDVLIVEDIVDTGMTLGYLVDLFKARQPKSLRVASLLFKPGSFKGPYKPDYIGFEIPNDFVVGYGMDLGEEYRNLRFIGRLASR